MVAAAAPKWQARDDVYQVGQLLGMLVKGDARARIRTSEVRTLRAATRSRRSCYRCIGERRKRYETADELIEALRTRPAALTVRRLRTLKGVHLAFTGILTKTRARSGARRPARRRRRARWPLRADNGRRARPTQRAAGGADVKAG